MLPFDLPMAGRHSVLPIWNGEEFILGDQRTPVLEYSENFAGWSDDLTRLHDEVDGDHHPIACASRQDAILQIKKIMSAKQSIIMEIGCSSGFLIQELVTTFPQATIIGVDVVKIPLYQLAKKIPGIPFIRFDLLQCPLPNKVIDIIVMLNVLEHIENDMCALTKVFNLLKPGGCLIIEVPAGPYLYDSYDAELCHFMRYSSLSLEKKLIKVGFELCRKSHIGFIVFPGFAAVKVLNKCFFSRKNRGVVRDKITQTSGNALIKYAIEFETKYLSNFQLPFGIRVVMTARRRY